MSGVVRLLGPPRVERVGEPLPAPRGRKPWALLALVVTSSGPVPRRRAQELLFADAVDPSAALRWTLSQVRRATGDLLRIGGDPLVVEPAEGTCVDVLDVLAGRTPTAWPLAEAVLPLLEGAEPDAPGFGVWLIGRRHALREAATALRARRRSTAPAGRGAVRDLVRLGDRMMDDGAARDGVRVLAGAVRRARTLDDPLLLAEALVRFGTAVVHAVACADPVATTALREADRLATRERHPALSAAARSELAFVATAAGDLPGALRWADLAAAAAGSGAAERAAVHYVRGFALVGAGRSAAAVAELDRAVELAQDGDRPRLLATAVSNRARARLQRGELDRAAADIALATAVVDELDWTALRPWVDVLHVEMLLAAGRPAQAEPLLAGARTLAEVLGDGCWEALIDRATAELEAARGRPAVAALTESCTVFASGPDACRWIELSMRDALCSIRLRTVHSAVDRTAALREATVLADRAARFGLEEFVLRAAVHRARLGHPDARAEALARAAGQDNPELAALTGALR